MSTVEFTKKVEFGDSINFKAFRKEESWKPFSFKEFLDLKIENLHDVGFRMIAEFDFSSSFGKKRVRICTHEEDCSKLLSKYPNDACVSIGQIINLWKTNFNPETTLPRVLVPASILGAEIIK